MVFPELPANKPCKVHAPLGEHRDVPWYYIGHNVTKFAPIATKANLLVDRSHKREVVCDEPPLRAHPKLIETSLENLISDLNSGTTVATPKYSSFPDSFDPKSQFRLKV